MPDLESALCLPQHFPLYVYTLMTNGYKHLLNDSKWHQTSLGLEQKGKGTKMNKNAVLLLCHFIIRQLPLLLLLLRPFLQDYNFWIWNPYGILAPDR